MSDLSDFRCPRRDEISNDTLGIKQDHWRNNGNFHTCSYCGSMHSDDFMRFAKEGVELGPTDKNYKVYVKVPEYTGGKFYFQHLPQEEKQPFIDLLNSKQLNIGYPGFFYRLPFFIAPATKRE